MEFDKKVAQINKDIFKALLLSDRFKNEVKKIRKEFNISADGFKNNKDISAWQKNAENIINNFSEEINKAIKTFKLSKNFDLTLRTYLVTGEMAWIPASNFAISPNNDLINLVIYRKPTKREWLCIKNNVNNLISLEPKNRFITFKENNYPFGSKIVKQKRTLERDIRAINLRSKKTNYQEIENDLFPDEDDNEFKIKRGDSIKNIQKIKTAINRRKK
jgi:hypothetical protein